MLVVSSRYQKEATCSAPECQNYLLILLSFEREGRKQRSEKRKERRERQELKERGGRRRRGGKEGRGGRRKGKKRKAQENPLT